MRDSCIQCVIKHLGKAAILLQELRNYPHHFVYVIGNLSEAEDEAEKMYPEIRNRIYAVRKALMRGEDIELDNLVSDIYERYRQESSL